MRTGSDGWRRTWRRIVGGVLGLGLVVAATLAPASVRAGGSDDRLTIDAMSAYGPLARATVAFPHDRHVTALSRPGAPDDAVCATCHLQDKDGNLFEGFRRDDGPATGDRLRAIFHEGCIGCHMKRAAADRKAGPGDVQCRGCHNVAAGGGVTPWQPSSVGPLAFLTGPMLWLAFAVFFVGCLWRVVVYVRGLDWRLDRVPYGYFRGLALKGALRSIGHWLLPYGARNWRLHPAYTAAAFLFHVGLVIVPLFLYAHGVILRQRFGFAWPALPADWADGLTLLAVAAGVFLLVRRYVLPQVRILTTLQDWLVMALSLAPLVTGFVAAHQTGPGNGWLVAHIMTGELLLIAIPFTKLSHVVLFFCSRAQIGMDFGVKRGGQNGSGIVW